jgi:hypothetical protein
METGMIDKAACFRNVRINPSSQIQRALAFSCANMAGVLTD